MGFREILERNGFPQEEIEKRLNGEQGLWDGTIPGHRLCEVKECEQQRRTSE